MTWLECKGEGSPAALEKLPGKEPEHNYPAFLWPDKVNFSSFFLSSDIVLQHPNESTLFNSIQVVATFEFEAFHSLGQFSHASVARGSRSLTGKVLDRKTDIVEQNHHNCALSSHILQGVHQLDLAYA